MTGHKYAKQTQCADAQEDVNGLLKGDYGHIRLRKLLKNKANRRPSAGNSKL
jgi:hypothetical protein